MELLEVIDAGRYSRSAPRTTTSECMRNYVRLLPSRPADLKPARAPRETASTKFLPALLAGFGF